MVGRSVARKAYTLYASPEYLKRHGAIDAGAPHLSGHTVIGYHEALGVFSTAKWLSGDTVDPRAGADVAAGLSRPESG
jgi:hypothetical protein